VNGPGLGAQEPSARYIVRAESALVRGFETLAAADDGVAKLRELILLLAVQGKLASQSVRDQSAELLLAQIDSEKTRLVASGRIKRDKSLPEFLAEEMPWIVPRSWAWVRLGKLGQIVGGGTPKSDEPAMWAPPTVPWLTPADLYGLKDKHIERGRRNISEEGLKSSSAQMLPERAVLFSSRAPIGYVAIASAPLATNQGFKSCVPHLSALADYLYWFLRFSAKGIDAAASGTTFKEISGGEFSKVLVPLPPLAEQRRIVARVEELMKLCDALEQSGRLADEQHVRLTSTLFDALAASESAHALAENWQRIAEHFDLLLDRPEAIDAFEQATIQLAVCGLLVSQVAEDETASPLLDRVRVEQGRLKSTGQARANVSASPLADNELPFAIPNSWRWVRFGELIDASEAGWSPSCESGPRAGTAWGVLKVSAVSWGQFRAHENKELPKNLEPRQEFEVRDGDFLISRANTAELVARSVVVSNPEPHLMLSDKIIRLRLSRLVERQFFNLVNNSCTAREYYAANASGTSSSMKNVGRHVILNMPVPVPPVAEQRRIVARVEELRRLCAQLRERIVQARRTQSQLADALVAEVA